MKIQLLSASFSAAILIGGGAHATVNLLTNGSFETGDLTGWSLAGDTNYAGVQGLFADVEPQDGAYQYYNGAVGDEGYLSQTFSDIAGAVYTVTGWAASLGGGYFNLLLDNSNFGSSSSEQGYTEYSTTFVGTGSDTVTIVSRNDPSYNLFDNFSVTGVGGVPEPAAWATMLVGLGLAGAMLRRRNAFAGI